MSPVWKRRLLGIGVRQELFKLRPSMCPVLRWKELGIGRAQRRQPEWRMSRKSRRCW